MKKTLTLLSLVLALCLAFGACAASPAEQAEQPDDSAPTGDQITDEVDDSELTPSEDLEEVDVESEPQVLTGVAKGFGGDVTVAVNIDENGAIADVTVETPNETEGIGTTAAPQVAQAIAEAQSVNVDAVSGATVTSNAVIEAVTAALTEAGVIDSFNN
jgi:uncharacterized protein with FMN-binding domain